MKISSFSDVQALFEKPLTWLLAVLGLAGTGGVLLALGDENWSEFGLYAVFMGVFGRIWTAGPMEGVMRWCRRGLWLVPGLIWIPVLGHQLRAGPDGRPTTLLGHAAATVTGLFTDIQENMSDPPPLRCTVESESELLGVIRTDFLKIVNLSEKGVFIRKCEIHSGSRARSIILPEVIKPYDTVKVELKTSEGKIHFGKGDAIFIECEGYSKPLRSTGT